MFGISMGASGDEKQQYKALTSASEFATGAGESDISKSTDFMSSILSGDSSKISQALAPQISAAKTRAQEGVKTAAEFGGRSGGTAASTSAINDKVHSDITDLIGKLTGSSVSGLSSLGTNLLGQGMNGTATAFGEAKTIHDQELARMNDIFKSSAAVAAAPFTGGASLGGLTGGGGGGFSMPGGGGGGNSFFDPMQAQTDQALYGSTG